MFSTSAALFLKLDIQIFVTPGHRSSAIIIDEHLVHPVDFICLKFILTTLLVVLLLVK